MAFRAIATFFLALAFFVSCLDQNGLSDEGMWLFDQPPKKLLLERYGFDATPGWLDHLQRSAVRLNCGGSGAFVSADGLVLTNHHVGAFAIQKLSTKERNLLHEGFYARTRDKELPCAGVECNVLMSIEDVTQRIEAAVKPARDAAEAAQLRRAAMNAIEKESLEKTGLRSDVVTLYQGGPYHLYRYKKYTDVRLAFAPEQDVAFYGGDPLNFEYPRYDFDLCFFRVYENGQPVRPPHYLRWNPASLKEGDLTFVAGHPGTTRRALTVRHLEWIRDCDMPAKLRYQNRTEVVLQAYSQRSAECAREAHQHLLGVQNSRKAYTGALDGLQTPSVMDLKRAEEESLRRAAVGQPGLAAEYEAVMRQIDQSITAYAAIRGDYEMLEGGRAFQCALFPVARTLVRMADELPKPDAQRLREFREAGLDSLREGLFAKEPFYENLEIGLLANSLSAYLSEGGCTRGCENAMARRIMNGLGPRQRAEQLIRGTKLVDIDVRRHLAEGGAKAIEASDDPLIRLARMIDEPARRLRTICEQTVSEPQTQAYGALAHLRFKLFGADSYPDATFTLRLAFGPVKRCTEFGLPAPAWTTLGEMYLSAKEHDNLAPFRLPKKWLKRQAELNAETPLNFVSTADIIGGNSGSPVVNRNGELVGLIFDGDFPSLVWNFVYTQPEGRAISVHGLAILEVLRKVYDAGPLVDEMTIVR